MPKMNYVQYHVGHVLRSTESGYRQKGEGYMQYYNR